MDWPKEDDTDREIVEAVAGSGDVKAMMFLVQNGYEMKGRRVFQLPAEMAAEEGHLPMLRYIHENGGELTAGAFMNTVYQDVPHLTCLQFLIANGCPWFEG